MKTREKNGSAARKPQSVLRDRRGVHLDQHLVLLRDRPRDVLDPQDLGRPVPVMDDSSHAHFLSSARRWIGPPCFHARRPVELRGPAAGRPGLRPAPGRDHPAVLGDDAAPEVRGVELHAPDRLVHRAQLGHRERRPDERSRDARDLELDAHALDRISHDAQVVERQLELLVEDVRGRHERSFGCIGPGDERAHVADHREVRDGDDVHAGIAPGIAVGAELLQQACRVDAGLLPQLSERCSVECLRGPLEAAGDGPHALERRLARRMSSTCSLPSDMVRMTMSTVTAKGGNCEGS